MNEHINHTALPLKYPDAIDLGRGPLVLLFYDGFERTLRRGFFRRTAAEARRLARFTYRTITRKQVRTGFYTQFLNLCESLEKQGCDVRINDYEMAFKNPNYPIGVAGYPSVIGKFPPKNPVLFVPGDFGMPNEIEELAATANFGSLICFCEWIGRIYRQSTSGRITQWYAGINTDTWSDQSLSKKNIDCLIYDKIRWQRELRVPQIVASLRAHLELKGLSYRVLRYGEHAQADFKACVSNARSMIFLCEHETQGLAYQEAMSANVPVLAWDEGTLMDVSLQPFRPEGVRVSAVPYFSDECGATFSACNIIESFEEFWNKLENYRPRQFVLRELSGKKSAEIYLSAYFGLSHSKTIPPLLKHLRS